MSNSQSNKVTSKMHSFSAKNMNQKKLFQLSPVLHFPTWSSWAILSNITSQSLPREWGGGKTHEYNCSHHSIWGVLKTSCPFFFLAEPTAHGSSQARDWIWATAVTYTTAAATPNLQSTVQGWALNPSYRKDNAGSLTCCIAAGTSCCPFSFRQFFPS